MKNKYIITVVIASIALISGFVYVNDKQEVVDNNLNFGAVLALTGYASIDGNNIKDGIELAKADLVKEGINLEVEYFDDGTDPKKTVAGVSYFNSKGIKKL